MGALTIETAKQLIAIPSRKSRWALQGPLSTYITKSLLGCVWWWCLQSP